MPSYQSDRTFRVASFSPRHRQLILRSDPERGGRPSRVELYFGNVEYMALRPIFLGLSVSAASTVEREQIRDRYGMAESLLAFIYLLDQSTPFSFVVSGRPAWREAPRGPAAPSLFDLSELWSPAPELRSGTID